MKTLTHRDKSDWGSGPWQTEPDKAQWQDPDTGLVCLMVRNSSGALCGYVGVPEGHPAYSKSYNDVDVDVHGGLTFDGFCREGDEHGICHVPEEGQPAKVWWLGFDCSHSGDLSPGMEATLNKHIPGRVTRADYCLLADVYRDFGYIQAECASLAKQLSEMS